MAARLNVHDAIKEANDVFWRWPIRFCLPLVACGAVSWLFAQVQPDSRLIPSIVGLLAIVMSFVTQWAQVSVSAMYLRARGGAEPVLRQIGEVRRYPALWPTLWSLFGLYLLYGLGFGLVFMLPWYLLKIVGQGHKGIQIAEYALGIPFAAIYVAWVASTYLFALPLVAIRKQSAESCTGLSEKESRGCRKTLMALAIVSFLPTSFFYVANQFLLTPHVSDHRLATAIDFTQTLLCDCFSAWFTLVATQMTLQRFPQFDEVTSARIFLSDPPPPPLLDGQAE